MAAPQGPSWQLLTSAPNPGKLPARDGAEQQRKWKTGLKVGAHSLPASPPCTLLSFSLQQSLPAKLADTWTQRGKGLLHGAPGSASFSSQAAGVSKLGRGQPLPPIFQADAKSRWGRGLRVVGSRRGCKSAGPCRSGLKNMSVFLGSDPGLLKTGACA